MKAILFPILVFFLSGSIALADNGLDVTGKEWNDWKQDSKMYFVIGWMKCGISASNNMRFNPSKWDESLNNMENQINAYKRDGVIIEGVTVGQVIDTLDNIYSDPRTRNMDIEQIMPVVVGRLISGWTLEQTDKVVSYIIRVDKCQREEKQLRKRIDECSALRKERNEYLGKLQH